LRATRAFARLTQDLAALTQSALHTAGSAARELRRRPSVRAAGRSTQLHVIVPASVLAAALVIGVAWLSLARGRSTPASEEADSASQMQQGAQAGAVAPAATGEGTSQQHLSPFAVPGPKDPSPASPVSAPSLTSEKAAETAAKEPVSDNRSPAPPAVRASAVAAPARAAGTPAPERRAGARPQNRPAAPRRVLTGIDAAPQRSASVNALAPGRRAPAFIGTLEVLSDPPGASVAVNNQHMGTTPLVLRDLPAGTHAVRVDAPGFQRWSRAILVATGKHAKVEATLKAARQ
jgi:hypothetical protein